MCCLCWICVVLLLSCGCLSINRLDACYTFPSCPFFLCIFEVILTIYLAFFFRTKFLLQPMLCVTAVNPFLLSKVPALLHIMSVRKKIGTMLPYVRCPFRRSINRGLGNRRYLLESNDFFALRDLIDLSRGVFAG